MARRLRPCPWKSPAARRRWPFAGPCAAYESYHGVCIEPQALEAAVELTATTCPPVSADKAIDALDEACASVKMEERCPPAVGRADVAAAVSRHGGVPAALLCRSRDERLDGFGTGALPAYYRAGRKQCTLWRALCGDARLFRKRTAAHGLVLFWGPRAWENGAGQGRCPGMLRRAAGAFAL